MAKKSVGKCFDFVNGQAGIFANDADKVSGFAGNLSADRRARASHP